MDFNRLPEAYPDELWYSIVARYHRHSGNLRYSTSLRELFGERVAPSISVTGIDSTIKQYEKIHGNEGETQRFLQNNTLLPFVLRYYSGEGKALIMAKIEKKEKVSMPPLMNIKNEKICLRYCPLCCVEEERKYGEMYWHREHQILSKQTCSKHGCMLRNSKVTLNQAQRHICCADTSVCPDAQPDMQSLSEAGLRYERLVQYVLQKRLDWEENTPIDSIVDALIEKGLELRHVDGLRMTSQISRTVCVLVCKQFGSDLDDCMAMQSVFQYSMRKMVCADANKKVEPILFVAAAMEIPPKMLFERHMRPSWFQR